jgi:hypothetical protein
MAQTEAPTKQILMSDMFYNNEQVGSRFFKIAADSPLLAAALNDKAFSINASYTVAAGQSVSLNINFASKVVIRKVAVNDGLSLSITNDHGTGEADGVFPSVNLNMCSIDESPATSKIYYNATQGGQVVASGIGSIEPFIVSCEDASPAVFVTNTTGASASVMITVTFEELGPRNPLSGLTATTLIEPDTEMATYG